MEIYSQTEYPYVDFMGETPLPNHTYIDLNLVGLGDIGVRCRSDLSTCCGVGQGVHRGDWIPPGSEESLPTASDSSANIFQFQGNQRVILRHRNEAHQPSGIYRCDIATNAVHDDNDQSVRESVYVGLYASGGKIILYNTNILGSINMTIVTIVLHPELICYQLYTFNIILMAC